MADAATAPAEFPRYGFSTTEPGTPVNDSATGQPVCNSRLFTSQAELDAAGGTDVWKGSPEEAVKASTPASRQPIEPGTSDDPSLPRSRR